MSLLSAILIILALIIVSGVFTLFDFSLGSCRKLRLEKEQKNIYRSVLKELENKKKITLSCRLWVNFLRILAAAIAGLTVMRYSSGMSGVIVNILISALILGIISALLGDVLPKLISRTKPEKITAFLLPLIKVLSVPMLPFSLPALKFTSFFHTAFHKDIDDNITEDELRHALLEGEKSGIVESNERTMVEGVFYLGDRPVGAFMTHRSEVQWLDCNMPYDEIRKKVLEYSYQRCFPVVSGSLDEIIGAVYLEDIILDQSQPSPLGLRAIMKKAQFVPETMSALKAFESFKQGQANFLFVMDEYGGLAGIISIRALVEEIVGELSAPVQKEEPLLKQEDGSWLADGTLNIDDAAEKLSLTGLPEERDFHTLAGFILFLAGELPGTGDSVEYQGYRFKVVDMDGNRIDKLEIRHTKKMFEI
ncbi:MAG: hemolysin family protein [Treponema sp.]|nr:hemolysin family protein [Treponema sp.]